MTEPYQPRYQWRQTEIGPKAEPTQFDWCGFDGEAYIGRIRKESAGPMEGQWQWAASYPRLLRGAKEMPNTGHEDTARLATQKIEEFWDRCLAGMRDGPAT